MSHKTFNRGLLGAFVVLGGLAARAENLVPDTPSTGPNIWCTWGIQNHVGSQDEVAKKVRETVRREVAFEGDQGGGADFARSCLNEDLLFGEKGWADYWPEIRKDVYLLLDDGWDVPYNTPAKKADAFGSFELDEKKFPTCTGTPAQRLKALNEKMKARGWRGAAVWIAAQAKGENYGKARTWAPEKLRDYWRDRVLWSKEAGVAYWKVDWGVHGRDVAFRRMLTELARELYPELTIEHSVPMGALNDYDARTDKGTGAFANSDAKQLAEVDATLSFAGVFRTYDVVIKPSTTIDRAAYELARGRALGAKGILSVEDDMTISVGLASAVGIMRWDNAAHDVGSRSRWEPVRAVRWQRIAPAVSMDALDVFVSKERQTDTVTFKPGSTWYQPVWGKTIVQSAPAIISRGIENPKVTPFDKNGIAPYVMATLHPNGSFALAMASRKTPDYNGTPRADVEVNLDCLGRKICLFGVNGNVRFRLGTTRPIEVLAQDLAENEAIDVTDKVKIENGALTIPAGLGGKVCRKRPGDGAEGYVVLVRARARP